MLRTLGLCTRGMNECVLQKKTCTTGGIGGKLASGTSTDLGMQYIQ